MKRTITVVTAPWSEHPLEARHCTYQRFEIETPDETQHVVAVGVGNIGPVSVGSEVDDKEWHSSATIIEGSHVDGLVGKLLTYIDATYSDPDQRKAHKDLVRQAAWDWYNHHRVNGEKTIEFAQERADK